MLIYDALKKDHELVRRLLKQLMAARGTADPAPIVARIRDTIVPHCRAEEAVFYNGLRGRKGTSRRVLLGFREHLEIEALLRALQLKLLVAADWHGTARELKKALEQHMREEEREVIPLAKSVLSEMEARRMGRDFRRQREEARELSLVQSAVGMVTNLMPSRVTSLLRGAKKLAG